MVREYSLSLLARRFSHAYVNQAISSLHFYFDKVLHQATAVSYIRPKKENKLPHVLAREEVMNILKAVRNLKHQAILYLTYSSGLRVGEVVRLRLEDLDPSRKTLHIRQGKGRRDRVTCYRMPLMQSSSSMCSMTNPIRGSSLDNTRAVI